MARAGSVHRETYGKGANSAKWAVYLMYRFVWFISFPEQDKPNKPPLPDKQEESDSLTIRL